MVIGSIESNYPIDKPSHEAVINFRKTTGPAFITSVQLYPLEGPIPDIMPKVTTDAFDEETIKYWLNLINIRLKMNEPDLEWCKPVFLRRQAE